MFFLILWGIDLIAAVIVLAFFVIGVGDGTVSSFNIVLWLAVLVGLAIIIVGSRTLHRRGNTAFACAVAAVLAVPALLYGLILLIAVTSGVRWN
jgi:hypothetical protein